MGRSPSPTPVRVHLLLAMTCGVLWLLPAAGASAREPTDQEQYMVELLNRARLDPAAEVALLGTGDLNEGPPTLGGQPYVIGAGPHQPVAISTAITSAAGDYAILMNDTDSFCHTCLGSTPEVRMMTAGYVALLSDFDFITGVAGYTGSYGTSSGPPFYVPGRENLSFRAEAPSNGFIDDLTTAIEQAHVGLFNDFSVPSRGHRSSMMYGEWKEVGVGIDEDVDGMYDSLYISIEFAHRSDTGPFLTGVVYDDLDTDDFYTPDTGEGLGGVLVQAFAADTATLVNSTTTFASGGYSLELGVGSYDVVVTGTDFIETFEDVDILASGPGGRGENTKLDVIPMPEPGVGLGLVAGLALLGASPRTRRRVPR